MFKYNITAIISPEGPFSYYTAIGLRCRTANLRDVTALRCRTKVKFILT